MRDVARVAGVSTMAVSSVLHGTGKNVRVSAKTSEKIRQAARDLKYQPNNVARNLRSGKTNTIGVVFEHFDRLSEDNPYFPQLLNGIMAALFPRDYTLGLCPKLVEGGEIGAMLDGRFDGVLWARPDFTENNLDGLRSARVPIVLLHAPPGSAKGVPTFCSDNLGAYREVIQHLRLLGHKNVAYVIDPVNVSTAEGQDRQNALAQAAKEAGLKSDILVWERDPHQLNSFFESNPVVSAAVCYSDTLAGHFLRACSALGVRVPEDISVVGFDSSSFCDLTHPPLTSVRQPVEKIAFDAATRLLELIQDDHAEGSGESRVYTCGLDVRNSTGQCHK